MFYSTKYQFVHSQTLPLQKSNIDYMVGNGNRNDIKLDKTPHKPERVSIPSESTKFSLRRITKKMSVSMPELLDEMGIIPDNERLNNSTDSSSMSQRRNNSAESLQVGLFV